MGGHCLCQRCGKAIELLLEEEDQGAATQPKDAERGGGAKKDEDQKRQRRRRNMATSGGGAAGYGEWGMGKGEEGGGGGGGGMDESCVVLNSSGGGRKSGMQSPHSGPVPTSPDAMTAGGGGTSNGGGGLGAGVSARLSQLELLFDFVEAEGEIDSPLCPQCSAMLRRDLEAAAAEAEADADEYEAAVATLEAEQRACVEASSSSFSGNDRSAPSPVDFAAGNDDVCVGDGDAVQRTHRTGSGASSSSSGTSAVHSDDMSDSSDDRWQRRVSRLRAQLKAVEEENATLDVAEKELDAMEERYWQEYNDYMFMLQRHKHSRDAVLARIEATSSALETLKQTNVFNDAFHIWHDGPYGTISGFRLGRVGQSAGGGLTSSAPVEWDEINAAWGQCVLLLSTMASTCKFTFTTYRLVPMGSYSKVIDDERRATLELFGPISSLNPFKRTNFDRAMIGFLRCLEEVAEFASMTDKAANGSSSGDTNGTQEDDGDGKDAARTAPPPFALPYPIDGDKVGGKTIKLTFNREDKWTAALKLMLADLKCLLVWVARMNGEEESNTRDA